jgi:hypothetical protein
VELAEEAIGQEELMAAAMSDPVVMPAITQALSKPEVLNALLRAMRADLTDEQMSLFSQGVKAAQEVIHGPPARAKKGKT